jgi:hypothetical protein
MVVDRRYSVVVGMRLVEVACKRRVLKKMSVQNDILDYTVRTGHLAHVW